MENTFCIKLTIMTASGHEVFGEFFLGQNRKIAENIFQQLRGDREVDDRNILQLDLMESRNGLPVNIKMMTCDLDELQENCRIITKEMFRVFNLEE
ncbi:MAG: hypothetical protein ABWZ25_10820 [Chitinophagaceae bacterium]